MYKLLGYGAVGLAAGMGASYLLWGRKAPLVLATNPSGALRLPSKARAQAKLIASPATVTELLRTCPTEQEVADIHRDFSISFAPSVNPGNSTDCSAFPEGNASLNMINAFRVMKFLRFKAPIPTLGTHSAYDYLAGRGTRYNIADGLAYSQGWNNVMDLRYDVVKNPENLTEAGTLGLIGLILHEGRHAIDRVEHSGCRSDRRLAFDPSLAYGGSYATGYYWKKWIVDYAGDKVTNETKDRLRFDLSEVMDPRYSPFCDVYTGTMR